MRFRPPRRPAGRLRAARAGLLGAGVLLGAALGLGCARSEPGGDGAAPRSIVLYVVDTLRASQLGSYGHSPRVSPRIDRLAAGSLLFERAYAPAPWTLPSVVSILTSRPPCEHQVWLDGDHVPEAVPTWAERLRAAGYATANFHANPYAGGASGLERGFDVVSLSRVLDPEAIGAWLDGLEGRPFFLYLHAIEPHDPYDPEPGAEEVPPGEVPRPAVPDADQARFVNRTLASYRAFGRVDWASGRPRGTVDNARIQRELMDRLAARAEDVRALYDGDVRVADDHLAAVLAALDRRGLLDESVVALTSDHGEEFGEHDGWTHDQSVYEELIRVPLLLRIPGVAPDRVATPVSVTELLPTLVAAAGLDPGDGATLPLEGAEAPGPPVAAMRQNEKKYFRPHVEARGDRNVAWIEGRWKTIWSPDVDRVELYDVVEDPGETRDLAQREPERAAAGAAAARAWLARCEARAAVPGSGSLGDAEREQLRSLGYVE